MATNSENLSALVEQKYEHGFVTDIEQDLIPPGLDEDVVRLISQKKGEPEFMTSADHWCRSAQCRSRRY